MALPVRLILCPFLQGWDGTDLVLRLLVAPQTDPTAPPGPGLSPYVSTDFSFELRLVADAFVLPTTASTATTVVRPSPAPPDAAALCAALGAELGVDATVGPVDGRIGAPTIVKHAPPAYRLATGYGGDNPFLLTDDTYACALKAPPPVGTSLAVTPPVMSWGKVLAQVLRQPVLAEAVGLVRPFSVPLPADVVTTGGWVVVTLEPGSPWSGLLGAPGAVRTYAARIPVLAGPRPLFTPVLFPVAAAPPPGVAWDDLFREAVEYDDGFAHAVYARQPPAADPLADTAEGDTPGADPAATRPAEERGVQLGWDDEQVVTWFNRQTDPASDAPLGVLGYRVDVREGGTGSWESLTRARSDVVLGPLGGAPTEVDWRVEVAPNRLVGDTSGRSWLPSWFTAWTGRSLVGVDATTAALRGVPPPSGPVTGLPPATALRYGRTYDFRVRLQDLTGGGPAVGDSGRGGGPQPVAQLDVRRHVRPGGVRVTPRLPVVPDEAAAPETLQVSRPLLGFPACLLAGAAEADLLADLPPAQAEDRPPGVPDPDVDALEVAVEVAVPEPGATERFRRLSTVTRPWPPSGALTLSFAWTDVADVADLPVAASGPVSLPTSRDVRLVLTPLAAARADYYAGEDVRRGQPSVLRVRRPAADERALLEPGGGSLVEAFFLQPAEPASLALGAAQRAAGRADTATDDPLGRLAAALELDRRGTTLRARRGQRLVVGASSLLRHVTGPDGASVTFATAEEVTRLWIVAVVLELRRDWSWDGLDCIRVERDGVEVGRLAASRSAGQEAAGDAERDSSRLVFLDALDPKPPAGTFPRPLSPSYRLTPVFRTAQTQRDDPLEAALVLPVTTPPAQVPRLVSAGLALSPYRRDPAYAASEERVRAVWLELERPPEDPEDRYYARVLASAPDPVLTDDVEGVPDVAEPPLPVDPEPMRRVVPGQGDDRAGQASMQQLLPTSSPVHFLLPLPPGLAPDAPELFGFFTYEFRVGHFGVWTTAQGFAGRPLRVAGIQHAPPPLVCAVSRTKARLTVSAGFADPVLEGRSLRPTPPVTELWALLYAGVHQMDGADHRNVLLATQRLELPRRQHPKTRRGRLVGGSAEPALTGRAEWASATLTEHLRLLTLGPDAPLACLVVETLPGEAPYAEPLDRDLGYERFLRTSPLTAVPAVC